MSIVANGVYFLKRELYDVIHSVDGICSDKKERPVIALVPSLDNDKIFWAIPMGDLSHRTDEQVERLKSFIDRPDKDIRSCFYHIGNTDKKSIFFISDVIPVTDEYIQRPYLSCNRHVEIKNKKLIAELTRKISRILAYEKAYMAKENKPHFRQNIYGIYNVLIGKLAEQEQGEQLVI